VPRFSIGANLGLRAVEGTPAALVLNATKSTPQGRKELFGELSDIVSHSLCFYSAAAPSVAQTPGHSGEVSERPGQQISKTPHNKVPAQNDHISDEAMSSCCTGGKAAHNRNNRTAATGRSPSRRLQIARLAPNTWHSAGPPNASQNQPPHHAHCAPLGGRLRISMLYVQALRMKRSPYFKCPQ
jgi:hypothetical protein